MLKKPFPIKLSGQKFSLDPWSRFEKLRAEGDVIPVKLPIIGRCWLTTTYAATEAALKDNHLFVLEGKNAGTSGNAGIRWWMPKSLTSLANNMLGRDEPDHKRLRKLVDQAFGRRDIQNMRSGIEERCFRLLDALPRDQPIDLISNYTRKLPLEVICDLLGLPEKDYGVFSSWAESIGAVNGVAGLIRFFPSLKKMTAYLRHQIDEVRGTDRTGIIADLVRAEEDGDKLNAEEVVSMVFLLLFAGFETTTHLVAGAVLDLEQHPEQKADLLAAPAENMERAVEELARHVSSIQATKPRFVAMDTEFFGQKLKQGDKMMAWIGAANGDPAVFDKPELLKLDRFPNPQLVFSTGVHFCLGQQLARVEAQEAIKCLYERHSDLRLPDGYEPQYANRIGHRALKKLPVVLGELFPRPTGERDREACFERQNLGDLG